MTATVSTTLVDLLVVVLVEGRVNSGTSVADSTPPSSSS